MKYRFFPLDERPWPFTMVTQIGLSVTIFQCSQCPCSPYVQDYQYQCVDGLYRDVPRPRQNRDSRSRSRSVSVWVSVCLGLGLSRSRSVSVSVSALSRSRSVSVSVCLGSRRYYLYVCLVFVLHFYKYFSIFSTHLTKKSWFSLIIWPFKGNFENLTSSASRPFNQRDRTKSTMREKSKKLKFRRPRYTETET